MTDLESTCVNAPSEQLITKDTNALKIKNNLLKNGFKLALNRKNGYQNILSKSIEDLHCQKLISESDSPIHESKDILTKKSSSNGSPTSDNWFKTWPERCDKVKSVESSPENTKCQRKTVNTREETSCNKLTLNEALKNISLAYSPLTKQLHFVESNTSFESTKSSGNDTFHKETDDFDNNFLCIEVDNTEQSLTQESLNSVCNVSKKLGHRRIQEGSYSSTISTLSEPSTSGSLIGSEDRSLSNFEDDNLTENKSRRKSLTHFLTKNVFSWKSAVGTENNSSVWKIFGSRSNQCANSPLHTVASSSALIQLKRPSSLPAKTVEEEQRHAQEYNEILAAAKKKEAKTSAAKEKQKKLQLQQEEQQAISTKHFIQNVLPNWNQMEKNKRTQELWWQGLPSSVRGKVWRLAIGNELNITPQLYEICLTRAQNRLNSPEPSQSDYENDQESSMDVIELDISRTFPNLCIFQQGGPYSEVLHSLLAAYVCFRPDVGYVQGMSYIAAILILNMEACDAFVCFANLLNQPLHLSAFTLNQDQMNAYYAAYNQVFNSNLPRLYSHFENAGLTPDLYLLDWIYTVFAKAMPLDVACRVWDLFLRDGYEFVFRTSLGILHLYQSTLLTMDFLHGAQFLTRLPEDMSSDQLFKSIQCVSTSIGKTSFAQIVEKCTCLTDLYR
ncbi:TBC1 domain family member 12-like [Sitophilus oryzae]|uniref:TBC1 domain family member 12-like n=1 Tax=Sitophilus oryzae TaxID=7048 RepID=A0A6J2XIC9_SITOR|nr:TBC1 domain family member 12-like [Sitophilus oryzae]